MKIKYIKEISLLMAGMVICGSLTAAFWSSMRVTSQKELLAANVSLTTALSQLSIQKEINSQLTRTLTEKSLIVEKEKLVFKEKESEIKLQIQVLETQIRKQNHQWRKNKGSYEVNLAALSKQVNQLKQRLSQSNKMYAERYLLSKVINELNEKILKISHKSELSKKACAEFKKGNSWNRVSEEDCKSYNALKQQHTAMIDKFTKESTKLDNVNQQLFVFGNLDAVNTP